MKILIILFLIYLAFQVFFRFVLPLLARYMVIRASKHMQGQFGQSRQKQHYAPERKSGEVRIETNPQRGSAGSDEYTDFEEVK
jgi:hypothetical protein